jgi:hypothetical protein
LAAGVLVCSEIKVLLAGYWWLIYSEKKYCWLVADKPNEQSSPTTIANRGNNIVKIRGIATVWIF